MNKKNVFWGLLLVFGSIALVLSSFDYFDGINMFSVIIAVFLGALAIQNLFKLEFAGVLFPLAFIGILFDKELGITAITPWTILAAATLGSIGLSMIFHKKNHWHKTFEWSSEEPEIIDIEDENHIRYASSFNESIKYINSQQLEQVDLKCKFGAMKIYFDNANLKDGKVIVRLNASFSGVELYVPKSWQVDDRSNSSFSGVDFKNRNDATTTNTLILTGDIHFSGVEIIYT